MGLRDDLKWLDVEMSSERVKKFLAHNSKLLDVNEGNLEKYVDEDLKAQLSPMAYESAKHRIPPINILKKLIEKLSQCYAEQPERKAQTIDGKEAPENDQSLLQWYEWKLALAERNHQANEFFNLKKGFAYEPFLDRNKPALRVIPFDRFMVFSKDPVNPLRVTHFVKIMGAVKVGNVEKTLYWAYTDDENMPFYEGGDFAEDEFKASDLETTVNPFGVIPFVYCARSRVDLVPRIDSDTFAMAKLIPVLLTDLAFSIMYQAFAIIYLIDAEVDGKRSPNAIWKLKSDGTGDSKPEIGTIKPTVDIDQVLNFIRSLLTMWMESRNIKPGALGDLTIQSAASGIAKAIDEMDTSADRKKQVPFLKAADEGLLELVLNKMHPVWMKAEGFEKPVMPSRGLTVTAKFAEQRPIIDPSQAIVDQKTAIDAGLQSQRGAIRALYPDWSKEQVDELIAEIAAEKKKRAEEAQASVTKLPLTNPGDPSPAPRVDVQADAEQAKAG